MVFSTNRARELLCADRGGREEGWRGRDEGDLEEDERT